MHRTEAVLTGINETSSSTYGTKVLMNGVDDKSSSTYGTEAIVTGVDYTGSSTEAIVTGVDDTSTSTYGTGGGLDRPSTHSAKSVMEIRENDVPAPQPGTSPPTGQHASPPSPVPTSPPIRSPIIDGASSPPSESSLPSSMPSDAPSSLPSDIFPTCIPDALAAEALFLSPLRIRMLSLPELAGLSSMSERTRSPSSLQMIVPAILNDMLYLMLCNKEVEYWSVIVMVDKQAKGIPFHLTLGSH